MTIEREWSYLQFTTESPNPQHDLQDTPAINAALEHGLSNALIESTNTKIRLIIRMANGFRDTNALISMALLSLGSHRPALPRRAV